MDDDGSALRVGAKYKSFTDLECALKIFQQDNYVQLYRRSSKNFFSVMLLCFYILTPGKNVLFQYISNEVSYVCKSSL